MKWRTLCAVICKVAPGEVSSDGEFTVEHAPCLGLCDHAPALLVGEIALGHADPGRAAAICAPGGKRPISFVGGDIRILTAIAAKVIPRPLPITSAAAVTLD